MDCQMGIGLYLNGYLTTNEFENYFYLKINVLLSYFHFVE